MIRATSLSKRFGRILAADDVTFEVPTGRIAGLLGPNGAGKTTTMRMLAGFLAPTSGSAAIAGVDPADDPIEARRALGYLPESNPLPTEMRVRDYVAFRAALFGVRRADRARAIDSAIERCQLTQVASRRIGHLSKGYRQRVGLAAAIVHDPAALILDEPTSGLDPSQAIETRALLSELAGAHALLVSSHILAEVERTCDWIIVIAGGTVRAVGRRDDLVASAAPQNAYTVEALAESADPVATIARITAVARVEETGRPGGGWIALRIEPAPDAPDLREPIARACQDEGILVRELTRKRGTLEDAFAHLVSRPAGEEQPA